ncbi:serine hydrolase [Oceanicaulis sp.]|uniref:serine hydrolase n=1 Tax=Oceanicaulis sp. TaxID=1924941 RepID=UPI003F724C8C
MFSTILTSLALASTTLSQSDASDISDALRTEIETMRAAYGVSGLAVSVVSGDDVILSEGFGSFENGPVTAQSQCGLFSATKALTAFTLASLIEDGDVNLNARLGELLTDSPEAWRDIPLWRLYNHTSGLAMIVTQEAFSGIADDPEAGNTAIYEIVRELPLDFEPGAHSRYQQSGYAVSEMIVEARLGQPWPALVEQHLTGPAQSNDTVYAQLTNGSKSVPMISSAGGYVTTSSDMARIFEALNTGLIANRDFLTDLLSDPAYVQDNYGLGVILEDVAGELTIGHRGGGARANLRYAPQAGLGVMACTDQVGNRDLTIHVGEMVMRALLSGEAPRPHIASLLYGSEDASAQRLVSLFEREWNKSDTRYGFEGSETVLNALGYDRLEQAPAEAHTLFTLNARLYPESANVWDSLADAQLALGEETAALDSMRRALDLQPGNPYFQRRVAEHAPD